MTYRLFSLRERIIDEKGFPFHMVHFLFIFSKVYDVVEDVGDAEAVEGFGKVVFFVFGDENDLFALVLCLEDELHEVGVDVSLFEQKSVVEIDVEAVVFDVAAIDGHEGAGQGDVDVVVDHFHVVTQGLKEGEFDEVDTAGPVEHHRAGDPRTDLEQFELSVGVLFHLEKPDTVQLQLFADGAGVLFESVYEGFVGDEGGCDGDAPGGFVAGSGTGIEQLAVVGEAVDGVLFAGEQLHPDELFGGVLFFEGFPGNGGVDGEGVLRTLTAFGLYEDGKADLFLFFVDVGEGKFATEVAVGAVFETDDLVDFGALADDSGRDTLLQAAQCIGHVVVGGYDKVDPFAPDQLLESGQEGFIGSVGEHMDGFATKVAVGPLFTGSEHGLEIFVVFQGVDDLVGYLGAAGKDQNVVCFHGTHRVSRMVRIIVFWSFSSRSGYIGRARIRLEMFREMGAYCLGSI